MIIRLIDIVLLCLFGFMVIADVDIKGSLSLPSKSATPHPQVEIKRKVFIEIEIDQNDVFRVGLFGQAKKQMTGIPSVEEYVNGLRAKIRKEENSDIVVWIMPTELSMVQSTVSILDMCEKNMIPKNINKKSLAIF